MDIDYRRKRIQRGAQLWTVAASMAKSELYGPRLKQPQPTNPEETRHPHGYCHFPQDRKEDWFRQLTAEHLVQKRVQGGVNRYQECAPGERNEALDCRLYARAAAHVVGIDRWTDEGRGAQEDQLLAGERPKRPEKAKPSRLDRHQRRGRLDRFRERTARIPVRVLLEVFARWYIITMPLVPAPDRVRRETSGRDAR